MPVQRLKAFAAAAIALGLDPKVIAAGGLLMSLAMAVLAVGGLASRLVRRFPLVLVRRVQAAVALLLEKAALELAEKGNSRRYREITEAPEPRPRGRELPRRRERAGPREGRRRGPRAAGPAVPRASPDRDRAVIAHRAGDAPVSAEEWIGALARELGAQGPDRASIDAILELAATAAHASERIAAPITCWLGGASGRSPDELNEIAARVRP